MAKCPSEDIFRAIHSRSVKHVPQVDGWTEQNLATHLNTCRRCRTLDYQIRHDMDTPTIEGDQQQLFKVLHSQSKRDNFWY
jgi:hypothetical protein